eukprot:TRINITY_DN68004_c1_g9_i1.p1 TRINITY_DN68004_c1_g9~~TRINITY_DN68004_c1_g9_i1.p1  ORF type:complete len:645 (-),score=75.66 TRINITY_DN68004_c1_g9_i1:55-1989(-)
MPGDNPNSSGGGGIAQQQQQQLGVPVVEEKAASTGENTTEYMTIDMHDANKNATTVDLSEDDKEKEPTTLGKDSGQAQKRDDEVRQLIAFKTKVTEVLQDLAEENVTLSINRVAARRMQNNTDYAQEIHKMIQDNDWDALIAGNGMEDTEIAATVRRDVKTAFHHIFPQFAAKQQGEPERKRRRLTTGSAAIGDLVQAHLPKDADECVDYIKTDDGAKWPIAEEFNVAMMEKLTDSKLRQRFTIVENINWIDCKIWAEVLHPTSVGLTEEAYHARWHNMIHQPLEIFLNNLHFDRNTSHGTSTATRRPDYVGYFNGMVLLYGEEKKDDGADPEWELRDKILWSHGSLPYLLAYTAEGNLVRFYVLKRDTKEEEEEQKVDTVFIAPTYDLELIDDRVKVIFTLRQIASVLKGMKQHIEETTQVKQIWQDGDKYFHKSSCFSKRYKCTQGNKLWGEAKQAVVALDALDGETGVIELLAVRPPDFRSKQFKKDTIVELSFRIGLPADHRVKQCTPDEMKVFLHRLFVAVDQCHKKRVVHRDIRLQNIVMIAGHPTLIDFDHSHVGGTQDVPPTTKLQQSYHAPELRRGESHSLGVDVWGLCSLVATHVTQAQAGVELSDYCSGVCKQESSMDLTMATLLALTQQKVP